MARTHEGRCEFGTSGHRAAGFAGFAVAAIDLRRARKKNLTRYDVVTIASMIEREIDILRNFSSYGMGGVSQLSQNYVLKLFEPAHIDAARAAMDEVPETTGT